ncbi:FAD-binding oxidoreductase [Lentibacillus salicampi]|uniref:FAD-binding oxidoreductase n=1 Tax=Lentibacillus salicampi TaxID=175306 RepID=A0A4Y9AFW9_9BACI|nr:FAD-binding oxidoreductase [Lentibacillus salicampi]TFJ94262.1 FAD-binding oxidoreductase [Lentibacillus salicampi]
MTDNVISELKDLLDDNRVHHDPELLTDYTTDTWPLKLVQKAVGAAMDRPLCVVQPKNTNETAALLQHLNKRDIAVVPYGGGSGVHGGAQPNNESVMIDMGNMCDIVELDEENLTVTTQPGIVHRNLEDYLNQHGYISGHYPQSIDLAQIGGLVATRSAGQFSTKYGNIENLLVGLEAVLPTGEIVRIKNVPRRSTGPDLSQLLIGSEGTMGIITEITLKIFPKPADRWMCAYGIKNMREGLHIIRTFMREGWNPAVVRLHDQMEAAKSYSDIVNGEESILLILSEGPEGYAQTEGKALDKIILEQGGRSLGPDPVESWLEHRNNTGELQEYTSQGIIIDTIEIAANWSDIATIYEKVTERLRKEVPELLLVTGHSSHSYPQGTNMYFILAAHPPKDPEGVERVYQSIWQKVMEVTLENNGTICHHHGIGKLRASWMPQELGSAYPMLKKLKRIMDPQGIMNIGTLLPVNEGEKENAESIYSGN